MLIQTAEQHRGEILRQSREAHSEALAHMNAEIKNLSDEVLANAYHMFTKTRNQAMAVSQEIARLDPQGDLVSKFAGSVLLGVREGIQAQADIFNEGLNQALDTHISQMARENSLLEQQIAGVSGEVKKLQDLKVQDLVSPISRELTLQMGSVANHAKVVVDALRAGMETQSKEAADKLTLRNKDTRAAFDRSASAAEEKFGELTTAAEEKFERLIKQMEGAVAGKFWMERLKLWSGAAVIAVIASGVVNYLLFFRHFKY